MTETIDATAVVDRYLAALDEADPGRSPAADRAGLPADDDTRRWLTGG